MYSRVGDRLGRVKRAMVVSPDLPIMNGIEAMGVVRDRPRALAIRSDARESCQPNGMAMGLSICRLIVEAHRGRLWGSRDSAVQGVAFRFSLPAAA